MIAKRLARPTWSIADYIGGGSGARPDRAKVERVVKLSGLSAEVDEVYADLAHQLQFVQVLLTAETGGARPLARLISPAECPMEGKEGAPVEQDPAAWNPTSIASASKNGYYVVPKPSREE